EGWIDEIAEMSEAEQHKFERNICPYTGSKTGNTITRSSTIHLPAWRESLSQLKVKVTLLPRDVATRWNSTLDMLEYILSHKKAVNRVTQRLDGGL
ncbi:hypothetical protein L210DRAFT_3401092, partial [Boletus edulis BED1]